jgi:polyribonucleotide nucleotidyltransferase
VVVEDVDPNGKISLKPVGDGPEATGGGGSDSSPSDSSEDAGEESGDRVAVSFDASFDEDLASEFGDLGPEAPRRSGGGGGGRGRGRGGRGRR